MDQGLRVQGLGFGVQGLRFRVQGLGFRVWGLAGYRDQGLGVWDVSIEFEGGLRVWGFKDPIIPYLDMLASPLSTLRQFSALNLCNKKRCNRLLNPKPLNP